MKRRIKLTIEVELDINIDPDDPEWINKAMDTERRIAEADPGWYIGRVVDRHPKRVVTKVELINDGN